MTDSNQIVVNDVKIYKVRRPKKEALSFIDIKDHPETCVKIVNKGNKLRYNYLISIHKYKTITLFLFKITTRYYKSSRNT
jgi:hypothetical protein